MNENDARLLARKLFDFLSPKLDKFRFVLNEVPVLNQTNGYDCGIHVLCNAEHATRFVFLGRRHSTEVAFALLTQLPWVRFSAFSPIKLLSDTA